MAHDKTSLVWLRKEELAKIVLDSQTKFEINHLKFPFDHLVKYLMTKVMNLQGKCHECN